VAEQDLRKELNDLRAEYRADSQKSLDKCFSYLNFYVGLLAAVLAATLTGLLQIRPGDSRALLLLTGPLSASALAVLGYRTIRVFYRRSVEAWVAEVNLQAMLGLGDVTGSHAVGRPLVASRSGGWLPRFERSPVEKVMNSAENAESMIVEVTRIGDTLRYARLTLAVFSVVAVVLSAAAIVIATR